MMLLGLMLLSLNVEIVIWNTVIPLKTKAFDMLLWSIVIIATGKIELNILERKHNILKW